MVNLEGVLWATTGFLDEFGNEFMKINKKWMIVTESVIKRPSRDEICNKNSIFT